MTAAPLTLSRRSLYTLLITVAAAMMFGRICAAELVYEPSLYQNEDEPGHKRKWPKKVPTPMPTFSSNDRSRWLTIQMLATKGTYVIGERHSKEAEPKYYDTGLVTESGWGTIDKVLNPETWKFYSSKPPLLSTLVAGVYWLLLQCGLSLLTHPFAVVRIILVLVNLLPFVFYLHLMSRLLDRYGTTDWGRLYVFVAAAFATLLTPFAITLNNHSIATCCVVFALYPALFVWERNARRQAREEEKPQRWREAVCLATSGFFAAFTVTNELPAAAFAAVLGLVLLWRLPLRTLTWFVPAALIPIAAFFLTNYLAIGMWRPAYSEFGGPWYEYAGSHWTKANAGEVKHGIDWAGEHESRAEYILHCLIGHHGIFSLSPIWILAFAGMVLVLLRRLGSDDEHRWTRRLLAGGTLLVSLVVLGFYLTNKTVNYGGWTTGLRWLMWLSPLWLLTTLPLADWLGKSRWGRGVAYLLLAVSVMSVSYPAWNPWRHPWLYTFMEALGYPGY